MEQTLTIIKPDSVAGGRAGNILAHLEGEGFRILALRRMRLSEAQARTFYEVHKERPFYDSLVEFMTSGSIIAGALEREDAVTHLRRVMGATDPAAAEEWTIRALYGSSIERNAIHGSVSPEFAAEELLFFFSRAELITA
ncbi:MAG: nucleoside-diphosphate kinase [Thermoanaerobaculia bacterium]